MLPSSPWVHEAENCTEERTIKAQWRGRPNVRKLTKPTNTVTALCNSNWVITTFMTLTGL